MIKSTPYIHNTSNMMLHVILACIPAIITSSYFYGSGCIKNIIWAILFAILSEALFIVIRYYRQQHLLRLVAGNILNYSAILTAILLSLCLPPDFSPFKILIGIIFAIIITKQLYGGLGHNIFNPAMMGFVILLIAYPTAFTHWPAPIDFFSFLDYNLNNFADDVSQATPLDPAFNNKYQLIYIHYIINLSWLLGGLYLIYRKIINLVLPSAFILGIIIISNILYYTNQSITYHPLSQLLLGGTMMGAFFIITDPVTASTTPLGRWIYGLLAGVFCMMIREYAGYPDGVAFAILFMNVWVPLINKLTIKAPFGY